MTNVIICYILNIFRIHLAYTKRRLSVRGIAPAALPAHFTRIVEAGSIGSNPVRRSASPLCGHAPRLTKSVYNSMYNMV